MKKIVSLMLAAITILILFTSCGNNGETIEQNVISSAKSTVKPLTENNWLDENLQSIHQNLLDGNYSIALKLLLEGKEIMKDDLSYNALLYIAYMVNDQPDLAKVLYTHMTEVSDTFSETVTETLKTLEENTEIADKLKKSDNSNESKSAVAPTIEDEERTDDEYTPSSIPGTSSTDGAASESDSTPVDHSQDKTQPDGSGVDEGAVDSGADFADSGSSDNSSGGDYGGGGFSDNGGSADNSGGGSSNGDTGGGGCVAAPDIER